MQALKRTKKFGSDSSRLSLRKKTASIFLTRNPSNRDSTVKNLPPWKTIRVNSSTCESPRCPIFDYELHKSSKRIVHLKLMTSLHSYVPRKCSATNRIIKAKDHASVQISVGKVDENGRFTGESQVYALCGFVRAMGESDDSLNRLAQRDGLLKNVWSGSSQR